MGSRLRESLQPRISFFAFQDIITSTSGILIIVVLLLGTFLGAQLVTDPGKQQRYQKELEEQKEVLDEEVARLEQALGDLREKSAEVDPEKLERDLAVLRSMNEGLAEKIAALTSANAEKRKAIEATISRAGLDRLEEEIRTLEEKNAARRAAVEDLRQEHDSLTARVQKLSAKVTLAETEKNKIWLIRDEKSSSKAPLILFLSPQDCRLWEMDRPQKTRSLPTRTEPFLEKLEEALRGYRSSDAYVVIYVQPGAVSLFERARELLQDKLHFDAGWDAVEEGVIIQSGTPPAYQLEEPEPISSRPGKKA